MNGLSTASQGRIGNGLQWAEEVLVDEAVDVRVVRPRRSFGSKDFAEQAWLLGKCCGDDLLSLMPVSPVET